MEKFALFRLLDALAGLAPPAADPPQEAPREGATQEPPAEGGAQGGVFSGEERRRRAEQLLARHDAISRRIDRRKKP